MLEIILHKTFTINIRVFIVSNGQNDVSHKRLGRQNYYMKNITSYKHTNIFCVYYSSVNNKCDSANNLHECNNLHKVIINLYYCNLSACLKSQKRVSKSALRMVVTTSHLGLGVKAVNIKE